MVENWSVIYQQNIYLSPLNKFGFPSRQSLSVRYLYSLTVQVQSFVTVSSSCANSSTILSGSSGILYSNKAQRYSNHMNCGWSLLSNNNIMLTFFKFDTERRYDFVNVYDGRSTSSPLIGRYHGTSLPPVVTSSSNQLFITFTSDHIVTKPGFGASYRGKCNFNAKKKCHSIFFRRS